jgi:DNA helicase-2/ATP-dependent DNA helicase PcrA
MNLTDEQLAAQDAARTSANIMLDAYAGTGKTTTLVSMAKFMKPRRSLGLAFNTKVAKELGSKLPSFFEVKTFNALGFKVWADKLGFFPTMDDKKVGRIISALLKEQEADPPEGLWDDIRRLTVEAMNLGLVPEPHPQGLLPDDLQTWEDLCTNLFNNPDKDTIFLARTALLSSIEESLAGTISFADQIYMSVLFGGQYPRYARVVVDEYQDLSELNIRQLALCSAPKGQIIVAGDPLQAIYAWRGASGQSRTLIRELREEWVDLPLTLTFRCPKVVVERQKDHAQGFRAHEGNREGTFRIFDETYGPGFEEGMAWDGWTWDLIPKSPVTILCRNNAPLLKMAFSLLRLQVGVFMLGRDIGKGLITLSKKILPQNSTPAKECRVLIESWQREERAKAIEKDNREKLAAIDDRAECLFAVLDNPDVKDAKGLRASLSFLFGKDSGQITLSTIHKFKGQEAKTIIHLDPWRIPSKWARKQGGVAMEQEMNLRYVCETRAMENLILANLEDFQPIRIQNLTEKESL